jgi:hypothetical protein
LFFIHQETSCSKGWKKSQRKAEWHISADFLPS